jgi:hypothetical protein
MKLKFGVVGFSSGNGHPFSWSIACNGYSSKNLSKIPYPRVKDYLPKYDMNLCKLNDAEVTHVWTQDNKYSKLIANICNIKKVCKSLDELASSVDAILFLRDDVISRERYLHKLIKTGKPILVDKFLHFKPKKVSQFLNSQKFDGQLFSESPLIHNKKIILNKREIDEIGKVKLINATASGSWNQYAIHIVEPVLRMIKKNKIKKITSTKTKTTTTVTLEWSDDLITVFSTIKDSNLTPFTEIIGSKSSLRVNWDFDYVFDNFITSLKKFTYIVKNKKFVKYDNHHHIIAKILQSGN